MGAFFFRSRSAMVFYTYQGIRFRGSKFYYNPFHKIKDRFGDLEQKVACGFFNRSTFLKAANGQRPGNWFYDDGRKFPSIIFGEDVIQDHWNKRFPNKNAHVFSFISRDRMFYHHPRDLWIEKQVALMKKHRVGYGEGFRLMEREYQKQLYVSQLERQHQLQQVAELGGCTELNDRTWLDHWMVQEATLRSRDANEMKQRYMKTQLYDLLHEMISLQTPELETKRISIVDFHPSMLDQEAVRQFILENPELSQYFDVSWFILDKSMLFELYGYRHDLFMLLMEDLRLVEARFDRLESIQEDFYDRLMEARKREHQQDLESRIMPNHPNKFPRFLWEEETREMRRKDKEFADLLASTGNKDAHKWYRARTDRKQKAKDSLSELVANMNKQIKSKNEL